MPQWGGERESGEAHRRLCGQAWEQRPQPGHTAPPWGTNLHIRSPLRPDQSSNSGGPDCLDEAPPGLAACGGGQRPATRAHSGAGAVPRSHPWLLVGPLVPILRSPARGGTPERTGPLDNLAVSFRDCSVSGPACCFLCVASLQSTCLEQGVHYSGNRSGCLVCKIVSAPWHCHFVAAWGLGGLPKVAMHQPQSRDWTPLPPFPTLPRVP